MSLPKSLQSKRDESALNYAENDVAILSEKRDQRGRIVFERNVEAYGAYKAGYQTCFDHLSEMSEEQIKALYDLNHDFCSDFSESIFSKGDLTLAMKESFELGISLERTKVEKLKEEFDARGALINILKHAVDGDAEELSQLEKRVEENHKSYLKVLEETKIRHDSDQSKLSAAMELIKEAENALKSFAGDTEWFDHHDINKARDALSSITTFITAVRKSGGA